MAKRKKKVEVNQKEKLEVELSPPPPQDPQISLDVYFSLKKIKLHWQPGMKVYKGALEEGSKSKKDWDKFFEEY